MNLSDRRNYELHRAVAEKIERNPDLLDHVLRTIDRFERTVGAHPHYERWRQIIGQGTERVVEALLDIGEEGQVLRSSSPFVGILTDEERLGILRQIGHDGTHR